VDPSLVPNAVTLVAILGSAALLGFRSKYLAWPIAALLLGGSYVAIHVMDLTNKQREGAVLGLIIGAFTGAVFTIIIKAWIAKRRNQRRP